MKFVYGTIVNAGAILAFEWVYKPFCWLLGVTPWSPTWYAVCLLVFAAITAIGVLAVRNA